MDEKVAARFGEVETLADQILAKLNEVVSKLGFAASDFRLKIVREANYRLEKDPSNGEYSLVGDWRDSQGGKLGTLLFHADGSFFVEQDTIIRPHPTRKNWFVEAVNAWGKGNEIKAKARLIPEPE